MILHCSFEELSALHAGARRVLAMIEHGAGVVAPPQAIVDVEALVPRLEGDIQLQMLGEQESVERALRLILSEQRDRMDRTVLEQHVGAEDTIVAYFDYAHVLTVLDRVQRIGEEMRAMIELMTGAAPDSDAARSITFPD